MLPSAKTYRSPRFCGPSTGFVPNPRPFRFPSEGFLTSQIEELKKKLEVHPDSLAFAPLAEAYRKEGKFDEALDVCGKGLQKHPNYSPARVVLARVYQEQGRNEQALGEFKKVLELDPENTLAHSLLASLYLSLGDYQPAIEEFHRILSLNPDDESAQKSLHRAIEKAAGIKSPGEPSGEGPASVEPKSPAKESTATLTIGELYLKQGHADKAIEVFKELLERDPQNSTFRRKLSEAIEVHKVEPPGPSAPKLKKAEFIRPLDQQEDTLMEELKADWGGRGAKREESKLTTEDILQVMGGGGGLPGQDDIQTAVQNAFAGGAKLSANRVEGGGKIHPDALEFLSTTLSALGSQEGVKGCFLLGNEGRVVASNGALPGKGALRQTWETFQGASGSLSASNQGKLRQAFALSESGNLLWARIGDLLLLLVAEPGANLAILRLSLDSTTEKMEKALKASNP